jgi:hypothetical protein
VIRYGYHDGEVWHREEYVIGWLIDHHRDYAAQVSPIFQDGTHEDDLFTFKQPDARIFSPENGIYESVEAALAEYRQECEAGRRMTGAA